MTKKSFSWKPWAGIGLVSGLIYGVLFTLLAGGLGYGLGGTSGAFLGVAIGTAVLAFLPIVSAIMWIPIGFIHEVFFSKFIGQLPAFQELVALIVIINVLSALVTGTFSVLGLIAAVLGAMVSVFLIMFVFKMIGWKLPVK